MMANQIFMEGVRKVSGYHPKRYSRDLYSPVDIWTISLLEAGPDFLAPDEADRAARFKFERDRMRWTRARSALRRIVGEVLGVTPRSVQFRYGVNGKPAVEGSGIEFNLSHSGDYALVAVSRNAIPVGVDIEKMRPDIDLLPLLERLGETDLPSSTAELYARWARREARAKAAGGQLFIAPAGNIIAIDLAAPAGYSAAVALVGFAPAVHVKIEHA
jgi:phosphopantetheinyl transferase